MRSKNKQDRSPKRNAEIIEQDRLAKWHAAKQKFDEASRVLAVTLDCNTFGLLVSAAIVHQTTPEEVAAAFLSENICEWHSNNFALDE